MYRHLYFQSIILLVLLNLYCYSSPVPFNDRAEEQQLLSSSHMNEQDKKSAYLEMMEPFASNKKEQFYSSNILCALYGDCYNNDQPGITYTDTKPKRLPSNLFHGFPKFGKRAFTSAFSGIPKFG